jgi:hypothetical protein
MPSRRLAVRNFYNRPGSTLLTSSTTPDAAYSFRGEEVAPTVVVRCDLNGYSTWSREVSLRERVQLLNETFTKIVWVVDACKGVYFRDEGDCVVALFSDYFQSGATARDLLDLCLFATKNQYGPLTIKTSVAIGNVAYYQKPHEVDVDDWSAEGEPFVRAARLEQNVDSKQRIYFYADEYRNHFNGIIPVANEPGKATWNLVTESAVVPGLGYAAGRVDVTYLEYIG